VGQPPPTPVEKERSLEPRKGTGGGPQEICGGLKKNRARVVVSVKNTGGPILSVVQGQQKERKKKTPEGGSTPIKRNRGGGKRGRKGETLRWGWGWPNWQGKSWKVWGGEPVINDPGGTIVLKELHLELDCIETEKEANG